MCLLNRTASGLNNLKSEAVRLKNNPMKLIKTILLAACVLTMWLAAPQSHAQGTTAFTYQGQLHDGGTNANGAYTMIFKLYDASTIGNQIGSTITTSPTLANGLFSVNLDFGNAFNGSARWLDITVTNGGVAQTLSPRVQVLPTPYAQFAAVAATVTNGAIMNAQIANGAVTAANISGAVTSAASLTNGAWSVGVGNVQSPNGGPLFTNSLFFSEQGVVQALFSSSLGLFGVLGDISCNTNHVNAIKFNGSSQMISADSQGDVVGLIPQMQIFSASGTFVVPTNVTRIMVEMWGGGGGGGGNGGGPTYYVPGGGGGGGGFTINVLNVTSGTSYPVTIGAGGTNGATGNGIAGGTTSFGALMTAGGGGGGIAGAGTQNYGVGGIAGAGENGSTLFAGGFGQPGGGNGGGAGGSAVRGGSGGWQSGGGGGLPGGGGGGATGEPIGSVPGNGAAGAAIIYY
jgi:hypothetical protein